MVLFVIPVPLICEEPETTPVPCNIVAAVIEPPSEVDVPAIVIELFVRDALAIFDKVLLAPLIVLFVRVCVQIGRAHV